MGNLKSRVAYLQGLVAGLEMPEDDREGRILSGIVDVLSAFANQVEELESAHANLENYVENLDEDLYALESEIYHDTEDADQEGYVEIECPECRTMVSVDPDVLEDEDMGPVVCPNCGEEVAFYGGDTAATGDDVV